VEVLALPEALLQRLLPGWLGAQEAGVPRVWNRASALTVDSESGGFSNINQNLQPHCDI